MFRNVPVYPADRTLSVWKVWVGYRLFLLRGSRSSLHVPAFPHHIKKYKGSPESLLPRDFLLPCEEKGPRVNWGEDPPCFLPCREKII